MEVEDSQEEEGHTAEFDVSAQIEVKMVPEDSAGLKALDYKDNTGDGGDEPIDLIDTMCSMEGSYIEIFFTHHLPISTNTV